MTEPIVRVVSANEFVLLENYEYLWQKDGKTYRIVVPAGFEFDAASVPRLVHSAIGKLDLGLGPPLVHDWLYKNGGNISHQRLDGYESLRVPPDSSSVALVGHVVPVWVEVGAQWSRKDADRLFGRHMRELGVARWRRRSAYRAVRLFGGGSWRD